MFHSTLLFLNIGTPEMMLILGVAVLLFGGEKLPEIARGLGKGIREFKDASEEVKREITNQINNFEEKKTAEATTPEPEPTYTLPETTGVPNTMPMTDSYTATDAHIEEHTTPHADVHVEEHTAPHTTEVEPLHEPHLPSTSASEAESEHHHANVTNHQPDQF